MSGRGGSAVATMIIALVGWRARVEASNVCCSKAGSGSRAYHHPVVAVWEV